MSRRVRKQVQNFLDQIKVPDSGVCTICKQPLGADPHYIVEYPDGEHEHCWNHRMEQESFPQEADLEQLRYLAVLLRDAYCELVGFGRWLRSIKETWPKQRATLEAEYRSRRIRLRQKLEVLRGRLRSPLCHPNGSF